MMAEWIEKKRNETLFPPVLGTPSGPTTSNPNADQLVLAKDRLQHWVTLRTLYWLVFQMDKVTMWIQTADYRRSLLDGRVWFPHPVTHHNVSYPSLYTVRRYKIVCKNAGNFADILGYISQCCRTRFLRPFRCIIFNILHLASWGEELIVFIWPPHARRASFCYYSTSMAKINSVHGWSKLVTERMSISK